MLDQINEGPGRLSRPAVHGAMPVIALLIGTLLLACAPDQDQRQPTTTPGPVVTSPPVAAAPTVAATGACDYNGTWQGQYESFRYPGAKIPLKFAIAQNGTTLTSRMLEDNGYGFRAGDGFMKGTVSNGLKRVEIPSARSGQPGSWDVVGPENCNRIEFSFAGKLKGVVDRVE